jgi:hypothetical protein
MADTCTKESKDLPASWQELQPPEVFPKPIVLLGWPRTLKWDDFEKVSKPKKMPEKLGWRASLESTAFNRAWTSVRITPGREKTKTLLGTYRLKDLSVNVGLDALNTWVVQGQDTPTLLAHEQGHFNIAGLIARELHWRLDLLYSSDACQLDRWIDETENLLGTKHARLQATYDADTRHGDDENGQRRWDERISSCMNQNKPLPNA